MISFENPRAELYAVIGINYQSASVEIREKIAFSNDKLHLALIDAKTSLNLAEISIISTCNRTEVYIADINIKEKIDAIVDWLLSFHGIPTKGSFSNHLYVFLGIDAIRQLMKVASGIDSMIFGENQIISQIKKAYKISIKAQTQGPYLHGLFQKSFSVAKLVRSKTNVGNHPISVASAVNKLAKKIFTDIKSCSALLVGAGDTIKLIAKYFAKNKLNKIIIANRTLANAEVVATDINGVAIGLEQIPAILKNSDIVVTSTANSKITINKQMFIDAIKARKHKPIFVVDIAVPRDVDPDVASLADVFLYTIDDLHNLLDTNINLRKQAEKQSLEIIDNGIIEMLNRLKSLKAVNILQKYRNNTIEICTKELKLATQKLSDGTPSDIVLKTFAYNLTNKIMHHPSIEIKKAAQDGDKDKLDWAKILLGINSETDIK